MGLKNHLAEKKAFIWNIKRRLLLVIVLLIAALTTVSCSFIIDKALPFNGWSEFTSWERSLYYTAFQNFGIFNF